MENSGLKCLCRNSIKLKILEIINKKEEPVEIIKLNEEIAKIILEQDPNIDDNFLKAYIFKIIHELKESELMYFIII
jgi:hypothetical protein